MDKKSGVYYYLTDNSLRAGGSSAFAGIVPMYTTKGAVGKLTTVTAIDYREKLGYDLDYNPNYAGLDLMLSSVTKLDVLRLNKGATVANTVWSSTGVKSSVAAVQDAEYFDDLGLKVWVAHKYPGDWGKRYVIFQEGQDRGNDDLGAPRGLEYFLYYFASNNGFKSLIKKYTFSLNPNEDDFYKKVNFGDLMVGFDSSLSFPTAFSAYLLGPTVTTIDVNDTDHLLSSGYNGLNPTDDEVIPATEIGDCLSAIDKSEANVFVMNGFYGGVGVGVDDVTFAKKIVSYCAKQDRSVFLDAPLFMDDKEEVLHAPDIAGWTKDLLMDEGQFGQVAAVPDQVGSVFVQPSAYLFEIYAKMYATYGHVNYPPAGPTYGTVSASKLMDSNFYLYGDELKTARINYLTSTSFGVCMWEQRTLYTFGNSDLSYANTVFILRDLKQRLINFMSQFSFRYSTPLDLLTIRSGLSGILDTFVRNKFLVNYTLYVPTYEEAQAAGRELDINIGVAVISDMEVINLRIALQSAADLRAA